MEGLISTWLHRLVCSELDLLRLSEVAQNMLFLDPFYRFVALGP